MQRDIELSQESTDLDGLADRLREKSAKEVFAELERRLFDAERAGGDVGSDVLDIYLCILDEKDPVADDGVTFDQMWGTFKNHHPELIPPMPAKHKMRGRRASIKKRFAVTVLALLALLIGATLAFRLGNIVLDKGETSVSVRPSGSLLMDEANAEGYRSLSEALEDHTISEVGTLLTWIPEDYALDSVKAVEVEDTTKISATFVTADGDKKIFFRLICDWGGASNLEYEKNTAYQDTWKFDGYDYYFMVNNGDLRVMWDIGNVYVSIFGDATEDQLKEMVKSIKMR